jgi:putative peptidoglycan lipid II flippase
MLGGVLQLAIQVPALRAIGAVPRIGLPGRRSARPGASGRATGAEADGAGADRRVGGAAVDLINTQIASHQASAPCRG